MDWVISCIAKQLREWLAKSHFCLITDRLYGIFRNGHYETVLFLLQLMVTDFVKSFDILPEKCVAVAFAVAEFPLLLEETDLIFHVFAAYGAFAGRRC